MKGIHSELTEILHVHCDGIGGRRLMTMTYSEEQRKMNVGSMERTKNAFRTNPGWRKSIKKCWRYDMIVLGDMRRGYVISQHRMDGLGGSWSRWKGLMEDSSVPKYEGMISHRS
jgi:hypothetical protein